MDFSAVVQKARQILAQGVSSSSDKKSQDQEQTDDAPGAMRDLVYGRVCTTVGKTLQKCSPQTSRGELCLYLDQMLWNPLLSASPAMTSCAALDVTNNIFFTRQVKYIILAQLKVFCRHKSPFNLTSES